MHLLSQRDPIWSDTHVKGTSLTIGRIGCVITSIAMLSARFGAHLNPLEVNASCEFTPEGKIIWKSCKFWRFEFVAREYFRSDENIRAALADQSRGVILEVANKSHWVLAVGRVWFTSHYWIYDPWDGWLKTTMSYGGSITGAAHFRKK